MFKHYSNVYYGECTVGHVYTVHMSLNVSTIFIHFEAIYFKCCLQCLVRVCFFFSFLVRTVLAGLYEMAKTKDWPATSSVHAIKHFSSTESVCFLCIPEPIHWKFKGGQWKFRSDSSAWNLTSYTSCISRDVTDKNNCIHQNWQIY